jgi:sugar lactone lactonase YvrE
LLLALTSACAEQAESAPVDASTGMPSFEVDPSWPQLPPNYVMASVIGLMVDHLGHVWVSHRAELLTDSMLALAKQQPGVPAPLVMELAPDGKLIQSWGDAEHVKDYPPILHSLFEDRDGNIWTSAREQQQIVQYTRDGKRLLTIGKLNQMLGSNDTTAFGRPADIQIDPKTNELFVADGYTNRRIVVLDAATGAYKRHWGAYGERPDDDYRPDSLATTPSRQFDLIHNLAISDDGRIYAADQNNSRIQVFDESGTFIAEKIIRPGDGAATALALSSEPGQHFVYVGDGSQDKIWILRRSDLAVLGSFGSSGKAPGQFGRPHNMDVDSAGNLYVSEAAPGMRVQKFTFKGYVKAPTN